MAPRRTPAERFAAFIDTNGPISLIRGVTGQCHTWTGSYAGSTVGQYGEHYGQFWHNGRSGYAHRFAYEQEHGEIPQLDDDTRTVIDHRCRRRNCVNAAHLEAVTERVNLLRGAGPTARNAAKTTCDSGHDLTDPANVRDDNGTRRCLACKRERQREYRARKAATVTTLPTPNPQRSAA